MRRHIVALYLVLGAGEIFLLCLPVCRVAAQKARNTKKGHAEPLGGTFDTASCDALFGLGKSLDDAQGGTDTLEHYIEKCYADPFSCQAFGYISGDIGSNGSPDDSRFLTYRNWLFKVLYLSPDTSYYCEDAAALNTTFGYYSGPRGGDLAGEIAMEKYLAESGKCPFLQASFEKDIKHLMADWYAHWLDTAKDTAKALFDTTLPTLQEIGFGLLLGPQYAVEHHGVMPSSVLGTIESSPNPFTSDAEIRYTLNVPATLTVEVFDLLGKKVTTLVPSVMTTNGDYVLKLSGASLASGTYYVRFTVPEGEVRTLKLTKE